MVIVPLGEMRVGVVGAAFVNVADTDLSDFMVTVQVEPLVVSHPDQFVKVESELAVAVSTTDVPDGAFVNRCVKTQAPI
ncbi:MAG: hypothetical protein HQK98_11640 [Nitrospirae bacterium]|nr:hypothetical protein [Nitrospirota bacterium]